MSWGKVKQGKGFFFIAGALLCLVLTFPVAAQVDPRLGDLDTNGVLTTLDYSRLLNHINYTNGIRPVGTTGLLTNSLLPFADVTGDGVLNADDLHTLVDGILGKPFNPLPRPMAFEPEHLTTKSAVTRLVAYFNEPISNNFITPSTLALVHFGRDRILGTADDSNVLSGTLAYNSAGAALVLTFPTHLPAGLYQATVRTNLADLAGRMMTRSYSWQFATVGGLDSDGDGIPDDIERHLAGYLTNNPISFADGIRDGDRDADGDDLTNIEEIFRSTNPAVWDSDGDGWADGVEVADGKDPCVRNSHPEWSVFAAPPVQITRLTDDEVMGLGNIGTIVGRPPIEITLPALEEPPSANNLGTIVGRPPVEITRPAQDEVVGLVLGGIIGRPPIEISNPAPHEVLGLATGNIIARPPVTFTNQPSLSPLRN